MSMWYVHSRSLWSWRIDCWGWFRFLETVAELPTRLISGCRANSTTAQQGHHNHLPSASSPSSTVSRVRKGRLYGSTRSDHSSSGRLFFSASLLLLLLLSSSSRPWHPPPPEGKSLLLLLSNSASDAPHRHCQNLKHHTYIHAYIRSSIYTIHTNAMCLLCKSSTLCSPKE